ncbi:MAG: DNA polymerase III subunit alpha [Bacteroidales bacterium]|nr:DNA polymerase III subunit alpha [Bacteroidales bacterium]MCF8328592.1 DNA polymerase III subunit alpha [Bacteroidales bacterium]
MAEYTHLHLHTQYSILDGASNIDLLMKQVAESGMKSVAITDHGNMYGVMHFFNAAKKHNIKPIIGCEVYVAARTRFEKKERVDRAGFHLVLLAKNKTGYHNLSKIVSKGFLEGFYYKPRVDKDLLRQYSEGIIASSACLGGEVPKAIMNSGKEKGREVIKEYKDIFGEDFYLELQRHGQEDQETVNQEILALAREEDVKVLCSNDVHFIKKEDFEAHNILIHLNTGKELGEDMDMHYTGQEYLKSPDEMAGLFSDIPQALETTMEVAEKVEEYELERDVILPVFPLPEGFNDENEYLRHLTYVGAEKRYGEITDTIRERLDHELGIIKDMGFPGYFLIVQDFINKAREMDVIVGPGRGSAAGSAVAFCVGITNIDPIRYNLLFERFLNPERVNMPDVDVDFDDEGREKVMDYVIEKYGAEKVAQIVTFGSMAARSSIRDVARVLKLPLPEADKLAKLVPEGPKVSLKESVAKITELKTIRNNEGGLQADTLKFGSILEGSVRQTGTHACGVIIGPEDLMEHIPLATAKDSNMPVTQYDGNFVESVGMLKMDFLGLKTLSIIKDSLENIKIRYGKEIDIENVSLEDEKTFQLFQEGKTIGTFQFESAGMREYLKKLQPSSIEDIIAMNALYRPGPMDYIPTFIARKQGKEEVSYPHEMLKEILKPTYGIMVYQEQIMQTAQIMGGFTLGSADLLRRAMGKKKMEIMERMKKDFIKGAQEKNIPEKKATEVFGVMQEFANYGFNRSHAAAYSFIAYQTGYLKAHYPAEFMAAVLTHNINDIKKVTFFIEECQHMDIPVLGPDINESLDNFTVNDKGEIRFGMVAIKGVGEAAVEAIIEERTNNGAFKDILDLVKRVNLQSVNRKSLESLATAGAFDNFEGTHRAQYLYKEHPEDSTFMDKLVKHGQSYQRSLQTTQQSLFGGVDDIEVADPELPECEQMSQIEQLQAEKELIGFYISGHPLDEFKLEMDNLTNVTIDYLNNNLQNYKNREVIFAGMVTETAKRTTKKGKEFGIMTLEDYTGSIKLMLFSEDYLRNKHFLEAGQYLMVWAKVQGRYFDENQLEVKVQKINLLSEVMENMVKGVSLYLPLNKIDQNFTSNMSHLTETYPGKADLNFYIQFTDQNSEPGNQEKILKMSSRSKKVHPEKFVKTIQQDYPFISFRINQ